MFEVALDTGDDEHVVAHAGFADDRERGLVSPDRHDPDLPAQVLERQADDVARSTGRFQVLGPTLVDEQALHLVHLRGDDDVQ